MSDEDNYDDISSISTGSLHSIDSEHFFDYIDPCFITPLFVACTKNDVTRAREILQTEKIDINRVDNTGNTYLHLAVINNSYDVMKLLLETEGLRIEVQNHRGDTPLHLVDDEEILKALISAGAELDAKNLDGDTPLLSYSFKFSFEKAYKLCKILLEAGANPDIFNYTSMNLFYNVLYDESLTENQQIEFISMLLYYGADVNSRYIYSPNSVFMCAVQRCSDTVVDLMIPYVTDFNEVCQDSNFSLLMYILSRRSSKAMDFIHLNPDISYATPLSSCLSLSLIHSEFHLFKYIWNHCDKLHVLNTEKLLLLHFLEDVQYNSPEFLNKLYTILSSEYASHLVEEGIPYNLYEYLINAFILLNIEKDDRIRVIYTLLTISNRITIEDLYEVYACYGFKEELEAFMIVNMEIINFIPFSNYFTRLCCPNYHSDDKWDKKEIKSLQQISRDVIRKNLRPHVNKTFFQYYNEVQQLTIPKLIKDIICLKKLLEPKSRFGDYIYKLLVR